jgi:hypothetical protein
MNVVDGVEDAVGTITKCAWHDIGDAFERGNDARSPENFLLHGWR